MSTIVNECIDFLMKLDNEELKLKNLTARQINGFTELVGNFRSSLEKYGKEDDITKVDAQLLYEAIVGFKTGGNVGEVNESYTS